jgi:ureidoacrylate peracid hydrolase
MSNIEELFTARQERIDAMHRCPPGRTALVVVDMQRGFLEPGAALEVPPGRVIVPAVKRLIDVCRRKQVAVVFTEFVYATSVPCLRGDPFGPEHLPAAEGRPTGLGRPSNNCLVGPLAGQGPDSAQTIDELAPAPDELVIRAHTYDKFYGTPLDLALRSREISHLIVTGVLTDVCVNATILSAATRNYRVTAVTDGVATLWADRQQACFDIWRHKFARLRETAEIVAELQEF